MGRADTFREAMTAARSLHNRIRNHAIVSTFLLTVQLGCFAYMRSRHTSVARLREFFSFFSFFFRAMLIAQPLPFSRESRCIGSLGTQFRIARKQFRCDFPFSIVRTERSTRTAKIFSRATVNILIFLDAWGIRTLNRKMYAHINLISKCIHERGNFKL